jgi:DNA-binding NarL/FixJ family response regulator
MKPSKLLIIDDHPLYREALQGSLSARLDPEFLTVEVASSVDMALQQLQEDSQSRYEVILDIMFYGVSSLDYIQQFKALPHVHKLLVLTSLDDEQTRAACRDHGADGFISKNESTDSIFNTISGSLGHRTEQKIRLTQRQMDVLACLMKGESNKLIAANLGISEQTVKIHIGQIFKELHVSNRTQAVLEARKKQLITSVV